MFLILGGIINVVTQIKQSCLQIVPDWNGRRERGQYHGGSVVPEWGGEGV